MAVKSNGIHIKHHSNHHLSSLITFTALKVKSHQAFINESKEIDRRRFYHFLWLWSTEGKWNKRCKATLFVFDDGDSVYVGPYRMIICRVFAPNRFLAKHRVAAKSWQVLTQTNTNYGSACSYLILHSCFHLIKYWYLSKSIKRNPTLYKKKWINWKLSSERLQRLHKTFNQSVT